jgi:hypothetical protein
VITFHSLEDRIVKEFFKSRSKPEIDRPEWPAPRPNPDCIFRPITRKSITASDAEQRANPRARSAGCASSNASELMPANRRRHINTLPLLSLARWTVDRRLFLRGGAWATSIARINSTAQARKRGSSRRTADLKMATEVAGVKNRDALVHEGTEAQLDTNLSS